MKHLLKFLFLAPTAVFAITPVPTEVITERQPGAKPRNVVFILSDDHRYDAMSFLGHQFARTPMIDSLAQNGAYLKNALVTTSLCSPSRASILTGLYTFRHRVIDNNRPIPPGTVYFPQYLQHAGYATGFFGKWHMGGESDKPQPGWGSRNPKPTNTIKAHNASPPLSDSHGGSGMRPERHSRPVATTAIASSAYSTRLRPGEGG